MEGFCMLKPQDVVILLKILSLTARSKGASYAPLSQNKLAVHLCMSVSEVNAGIKRLTLSKILGPIYRDGKPIFMPIKAACIELLVYGVKYFIPVELGSYTPGIPTSYAAPLFKKYILLGNDPIPVWPSADGNVHGLALEPLYRSVPNSVVQYPDQIFYELLVLVDAIRFGRTRERNIAINLLKEKINGKQEACASNIKPKNAGARSKKIRKTE